MADKKIEDLTAIGTQSATDLMEVSLNGAGSRKETRLQRGTYWNKNLFSPAKTLYVATNGDAGNTGTFLSPFALPSEAIAAAVSAGVSNANPYLIIIQEGVYSEAGDLSLLRPGLFSIFMPGVRLTMNGYMSALGWSGVSGAVTSVSGFFPIAFAGVNFVLPSDAIAQMYFDKNNWNTATDSISLSGDNASSQSNCVFTDCVFPGGTMSDMNIEFNNCRGGNLVTVGSGSHPNMSVYFNGGTYFTSHEIRGESGGTCNGFISSAFVGAFNCTAGGTGTSSVSSISYYPGQIGQLLLTPEGGHATPTANCQIEGRQITPDADMINWFYQDTVEPAHTGAGKINSKFRDSAGNLFNTSRCSPINFRVTQSSAQTIANNTDTPVTFDTEAFDVGSYFSDDTFTPLMPGKYQFNVNLTYEPPAGALATVQLYLYKSGLPVAQASKVIAVGEVANLSLSYLDVMDGTISDNYSVFTKITGNGGSGLDINNAPEATYFCGFRVSD